MIFRPLLREKNHPLVEKRKNVALTKSGLKAAAKLTCKRRICATIFLIWTNSAKDLSEYRRPSVENMTKK
jgi:hypothetical protein